MFFEEFTVFMRILLLGGTGAMGAHLTELLNEKSEVEYVYVTSRKPYADKARIKYLEGNAKDITFLRTVLSINHWDCIVDFMTYTCEELNNRISLLLSSCDQYIFLSSARCYAGSSERITENTPYLVDSVSDIDYLSTNEYGLEKGRSEKLIKSSGLNWTIVRPYITYSENRLQLGVYEKEEWLYRALHGRTIVFSKDIANKMTTLTYGYDVAMGISKLIGNFESLGQSYHITQTESIKWSKILEYYQNAIEKFTGKRPAVFFEETCGNLKYPQRCYQVKYDRLFDRSFDSTKIGAYIDLNSFINTEAGIFKCISAFVNNQRWKTINWLDEARKDKLTGDFTPLREINGYKQRIKYILCRFFNICI